MLGFILKRLRREPIPALAVLLFTAILSYSLCGLHYYNEKEQRSYEEARRTVPVKISITNLSGTKRDDLKIPGWVADLLAKDGGLSSYMKDVQLKTTHPIANYEELEAVCLVGLTSVSAEKQLQPENGGEITWFEGFDESLLSGEEPFCLAPANLTKDWDEETPGQQLYLHFSASRRELGEMVESEYDLYLTVAGTYSGETENTIYTPYGIAERVWYKLRQERVIDSVSATLKDNDLLDELKARIGDWFAVPNPTGNKTEWGHFGYEYYLYALDVNDNMLQNLSAALENSILINRICTLLIFVLSTGVGFLVGFLMIRHRKREIALMRTMGASHPGIFAELALEQMLCVVLGIVLGGSYTLWQPVQKLALFGGIYFVGLSIALIVFLRKNLLTTIKEDE